MAKKMESLYLSPKIKPKVKGYKFISARGLDESDVMYTDANERPDVPLLKPKKNKTNEET